MAKLCAMSRKIIVEYVLMGAVLALLFFVSLLVKPAFAQIVVDDSLIVRSPADVVLADSEKVVVMYASKSGLVSTFDNEIVGRRDSFSRTLDLGNGQYKLVSYGTLPQFYKEGSVWYELDYATTTKEAFDLQVGLVKSAWTFIKRAYAFDTFFPSSDANVAIESTVNWAAAHDPSIGQYFSSAAGSGYIIGNLDGAYYKVYRTFQNFDTSSITSSNCVSAVTSYVYGKEKAGAGSHTYNVFGSTATSTIGLSSYGLAGTTAFSTAISQASFSIVGYNSFVWNGNGTSSVDVSGLTKIVYREATYDAVNSAPPSAATYVGTYQSSQAGTANDPYIEVTYSACPTGGSSSATTTTSQLDSLNLIGATVIVFFAFVIFAVGVILTLWIIKAYWV